MYITIEFHPFVMYCTVSGQRSNLKLRSFCGAEVPHFPTLGLPGLAARRKFGPVVYASTLLQQGALRRGNFAAAYSGIRK